MKKYINPKMEIKSFYSESILTGSALEDKMDSWKDTNKQKSLLIIDRNDLEKVKVTF